jgi:hypothetical protein
MVFHTNPKHQRGRVLPAAPDVHGYGVFDVAVPNEHTHGHVAKPPCPSRPAFYGATVLADASG